MTERQESDRAGAALEQLVDSAARPRIRARDLDGIPALEARLPGPFRLLFTTRHGGESTGAFSSLNLSPFLEDDPETVRRNRQRLAGLIDRRVVSPAQEHGLRVVGAAEYVLEPPGNPCDGLTLHFEIDKDLAALLLFADCVPVVLCGEVDLAVAHCGWRGVLGGMVQQAGRSLMGMPGTAVIGPSIGPCCFSVDEEIAAAFAGRFGPDVVVTPADPGEPPRVDLWAATARALAETGITSTQIVNPRICTACHTELFYSYRAEGQVTGRHGCLAWVAGS